MCSSINEDEAGSSNNGSAMAGRRRRDLRSTNGTVPANRNASRTSQTSSSSPSEADLIRMDPYMKNVISKRRRTIYILYFVAFLDLVAVSSFLPLMSLSIRRLGATAFMTGLIGSVYGAIQLISSPVVGWGSDIYGQKFILCICLISSALAYVIQGFALSITMILVARSVAGVFKHTQTIGKSIVSELSSKDKSYVIGNFNAFGSMGFIIGPTIGTQIAQMEDGGWQAISFFCAAAFLINTVLVLFFVPELSTLKINSPSNSPDKAQEKEKSQNKKTSILTNADYHSTLLLVVRFLFSFATLTFRENLVIVLQDKYSLDLVNSGYLTSLQALMSTVISFCVGPINAYVYRGNSFYMVITAGIFKCAVLLTLFFSTSYMVAASMLVAVSALNPFLRVGVTALSLEGHQNEVGAILGLSQSANSLARMFSPTAAGIAIGMSLDGPFMLGAMSAVLGVIATLIAQRYAPHRTSKIARHHPKAD